MVGIHDRDTVHNVQLHSGYIAIIKARLCSKQTGIGVRLPHSIIVIVCSYKTWWGGFKGSFFSSHIILLASML